LVCLQVIPTLLGLVIFKPNYTVGQKIAPQCVFYTVSQKKSCTLLFSCVTVKKLKLLVYGPLYIVPRPDPSVSLNFADCARCVKKFKRRLS